ncbi:MAG: secretion protein, partial [Bacteroidota bacterium]
MLRFLLTLSFFFSLGSFLLAQHTFSIVAVDVATGEVGSAGATCLTSDDCGGCGGAVIISDLVPGRG